MAVRELIVFKHSKELGDCPAYKLFDAVEVTRKNDVMYPRIIVIMRLLFTKNKYLNLLK